MANKHQDREAFEACCDHMIDCTDDVSREWLWRFVQSWEAWPSRASLAQPPQNCPTLMGEPVVLPYEAPREKINALFKALGFSGTASVGDILDAALDRLQAQPSPAQGELKPCPCCGGIAAWTSGDKNTRLPDRVECLTCSLTIEVEYERGAALKSWNQRAGQ